jgi:ligand-binding SRPBCC domain-containing protein
MFTADFESRQLLPAPLVEVFPFFSEARNLERITPPWLRFRILTEGDITMAVGTLIDYRLRWRNVPIRWRTEIEAWDPPQHFVDRQIRGPYRVWRHEHWFEEHRGGTLAIDRVRYAAPGGLVVHRVIVDRDVAAIFAHRRRALESIFAGGQVSPRERRRRLAAPQARDRQTIER